MTILSPRLQAALKYLEGASPFYKWRVSRSYCPSCKGIFFISLRPDASMTRCLSCGGNAINLSLIPVVELHQKENNIVTAWEMSTYGSTLNFLRSTITHVIESEYFADKPSGILIGGILNQDVQNLSFENSSIDLITSNHVFEHVPDDILGYSECYRVLRKNGALIFSVPLYDTRKTEMLAEVINGDVVFLRKPPEYHHSRIGGVNSALTFWRHSVNDICERVAQAGFDVQIVDITICPSQKIPTKVIYAVKK
jgi:SAM-dependent methyltransferase